MRLPVLVFALLAVVFARAADSEPVSGSFTAKELSQGYRDNVILARPRSALRAAATREEANEGVRVRASLPRLGDLRIVELDPADDAPAAVARLRATGRYDYVEPDYIRHIMLEPNDPRFTDGTLWQLKNTGLSNGIVGADIKASAAWDIIREAPGVVVAVVDTGLNINHQDLAGNIWVNPSPTFGDVNGARFVNGSSTGNPADDNGHGTHVAGTIGAIGGNNLASAGIAWRVQIMPIKVFGSSGSGSVSDIARGIDYAVARGAHIINASYGVFGTSNYSQTEFLAMQAAREAGIIFVAAAGNSAANMDVTRSYPASHALDNILTVGNSTRRDELSLSSNYGAAVDLFAPGSEIVSLNYAISTETTVLSGTSMAAPHVSGALALLKAQFPGDNYRQLMNRVLRGTDPGDRFLGKAQTGGRLNLLKALTTTTNRPYNDDFASRPRLTTDSLAMRANNQGGTIESGEPAHATSSATASIWWQWTAPTSGTVSIDTNGSSYDTLLAVYTGSQLSALTSIVSNDDNGGTSASRVTFNAQAGATYEIAVAGKPNQSGLTLLNLGTTPANEIFAAAVTLSGQSAHLTASNSSCSRESNEPFILGHPGGSSIWYKWTAPSNRRVQVSVISTDFDPLLGVFTGSAVDSLTAVAQSDNTGSGQTGSLGTIEAVAGTTYFIAVESKSAAVTGQFTLTLTDSTWQVVTNSTIPGSPAVAPDGSIYIGSSDRYVYGLRADGTIKWTYLTGGLIDTCSPAIANDGSIYIGSNDGKLYALSSTGVRRWERDFGPTSPMSNSPALAADGTVYVKADDNYLYALNPSDGTMKWRYNVGSTLSYGSPSVGPDGTIYQGSENKNLYAINPDGSLKWTYTSDNDIYTVPAIDAAGNLYFSVLNTGKLFSVSPTGTLRWTYSGASVGSSSSAALSADGSTVYYGGYDSKLHAVNTANGTPRWVFPLGAEVRASSPAVDANGVVYIGCYDFKLYAVNPNGTLKRTYDTGGVVRSSPVISGNTLFVGSNDNKLYAFDLGVGVAAGPWPQYRQNPRRTGRVIAATNITSQPTSQTVAAGATALFTLAASGDSTPTFQWQRNGANIVGATSAALTVSNVQPDNAGLYTAVVTTPSGSVFTQPAILGVLGTLKVIGAGTEVGINIVHPNNNTYDQILLQGAAATITADGGQVVRMSFVDLHDDIVQVEFSGAGALSLVLEAAGGPFPPAKYSQPGVNYMKGHAGIVIVGADENTHVSVFSVGKANAVNQALFRTDVTYDGFADIAFIAIRSANGKFGGVRTGNTSYFAARGLTGILAPGVQFTGPVLVGDINASDSATPALLLGSTSDTQINGGDLFQANGRAVQVSGVPQLRFVAGSNSHGVALPAQINKARLEQNGVDVTSQVVVNPSP